MKPCARNRKRIAWLALGALEAGQARELRAHLETCERCRGYLAEMSGVAGALEAAETGTGLQTSESFHRRVADALQAVPRPVAVANVWASALTWLAGWYRGPAGEWRVALPVAGALAIALVVLSVLAPPHTAPRPVLTSVPVHPAAGLSSDLLPTLANYRLAANHSLEAFDDLLTRQGKRRPPPGPVYTAAILTLGNSSD